MRNQKNEVGRCSFLPTVISKEIQLALRLDYQVDHLDPSEYDVQKFICVEDTIKYDKVRQIHEFTKKFVDPSRKTGKVERKIAAFSKFKDVVDHLEGFVDIDLPTPGRFYSYRTDRRSINLLRARNLIHYVLGNVDLSDLVLQVKHGSGTTQGVSYADTSEVAKFSYPITTTLSQRDFFLQLLRLVPQLHDAIVAINGGKPLEFDVVEGSRGTSVPKTSEIDRFIAIETTVGMFLQQALMNIMYDRLRIFGLDVDKLQDCHRSLAWLYSLTREGATVDFASASDCVLTQLVRFLFKSDWFHLLNISRTSGLIHIPWDEDNVETVEMPMFSTMGNATTFPIETLIFYALAHVVSTPDDTNSQLPYVSKHKKVSVYGDDCILPTDNAQEFIELCESVGFIVNRGKSFYTMDTYFRESCGADFIAGRNVRPVYLGEPTGLRLSDLESWLYVIFNNFKRKYISTFGLLDFDLHKNLWIVLFDLFEHFGIIPNVVPEDYPDDSGLQIMSTSDKWITEFGDVFHLPTVNEHGGLEFNFQRWNYVDKTATAPRKLKPARLNKMSKKLAAKTLLEYKEALREFRARRKLSDQLRYFSTLRSRFVSWRSSMLYERRSLDFPSFINGTVYLTEVIEIDRLSMLDVNSNFSHYHLLRHLVLVSEEIPNVFKRKEIGGYIVSKGLHFGDLSPRYKGYLDFLEKVL